VDQTTQAILTVGMPTLAVLIGMLVNNSRLSDLRGYLDQRFASLERVMDAKFEAVHTRIDEVARRLGAIEHRFDRIDEQLGTHDSR
jgi:hypothetical protein